MFICLYMEIMLIKQKMDKDCFKDVAYLLRALSNETRLCVLAHLSDGEEKTVSELMQLSGCEQSLLSHHLTDMRAKGILECRRSGKNSFYSLKNKKLVNLLYCIIDCDK